MQILFVHQSFPSQFRYLAAVLARDPGNKVVFLTASASGGIPGVQKVLYKSGQTAGEGIHHYLRHFQNAVLSGQAAYREAAALKKQGFKPDVILGHAGWGPTLFMKDLFPNTPLVGYFEWYYRSHGSSFGFDRAFPITADNEAEIRTKNADILIDLVNCDMGISPTIWQHSQFPQELAAKIEILHDGIDSSYFAPNPQVGLVLPRIGLNLSRDKEIITYVATGMEPLRGFPQFMEAIALLQSRRPDCHIVVVGEDRVEYGMPLTNGKTYKELMLAKYSYDLNRLHFTGRLSIEEYRQVLQVSAAHVYLTYPFILSWSMLEAMSCGCVVIGSNTPPVAEVIKNGENGMLVDFFNPGQLAEAVEWVLSDSQMSNELRKQARKTIVERYEVKSLLSKQLQLLRQAGRRP